MTLIKYKHLFISYVASLNSDVVVGNAVYVVPFLENENDIYPSSFEDIKAIELKLIEKANYDKVCINSYQVLKNEYVTTNKNVVEEPETAQIKEFNHFRCNSSSY